MRRPSFRKRIRNGALGMLVVAVLVGALALPEIQRLGDAIRQTLYRNYISIEAAQHMHATLWRLQLAIHTGDGTAVLPASRREFIHWIDIEEHDITEVGEASLAADIDQRGRGLFAQVATGRIPSPVQFTQLHERLDRLIAINRDAMFRANSRANRMSDRLTYEFAAALVLLLLFGAMLSWTLAWTISKPLDELADRLRSFSLRGPSLRLSEQPLAELQTVAAEFNKMAERLEQFERLNVDRLIYEKSKTEAIIESLEDGIVLIDPKGAVIHINEIAAIILGLAREEALGSRFDDLDSNSPHYLRVRAALHGVGSRSPEATPLEVDLYVRGRAHTYVLKPLSLGQSGGTSLGTILILQDVTFLRDKDRARTNLVATLSHELKTPLTSLGLSAELLRRGQLDGEQREMLDAILEDVTRMRQLANNLLDLARGQAAAITVQAVPLDLLELVLSVVKTFTLQAEQKPVSLNTTFESELRMRGDPLKLSWVVSNLIANALRYTPAGGTIAIALVRTETIIRLTVSDSGPGIVPQLREHLFERFSQWPVNGAEPGSAGLGLAIAKEIVEAHAGRIFVDSAPDEGTCFTVELPLALEGIWQTS
ncbi:MAG: ATP-binding protein [Candidatus Binataceae bacterium]